MARLKGLRKRLGAMLRRHPADEQCWLLLRGSRRDWYGLVRYHRGKRIGQERTAGQVEFDWQSVYDRQDTQGDVVGFWHTHPYQGGVGPSSRDIETMIAWCNSLGRPLLCIIHDGRWKAAYEFSQDGTYHTRAFDMAWYGWRFG